MSKPNYIHVDLYVFKNHETDHDYKERQKLENAIIKLIEEHNNHCAGFFVIVEHND